MRVKTTTGSKAQGQAKQRKPTSETGNETKAHIRANARVKSETGNRLDRLSGFSIITL